MPNYSGHWSQEIAAVTWVVQQDSMSVHLLCTQQIMSEPVTCAGQLIQSWHHHEIAFIRRQMNRRMRQCPSCPLCSFPSVWRIVLWSSERVHWGMCRKCCPVSIHSEECVSVQRVHESDRWVLSLALPSNVLSHYIVFALLANDQRIMVPPRSSKWFVSLCHRHFVRHYHTLLQFHAASGNFVGSFIPSSKQSKANLNRHKFECHSWWAITLAALWPS